MREYQTKLLLLFNIFLLPSSIIQVSLVPVPDITILVPSVLLESLSVLLHSCLYTFIRLAIIVYLKSGAKIQQGVSQKSRHPLKL